MDGKSNGSKAGMYKNLKAKDRHENENSCHFYWKVVLKDLKKHGIIEENFKYLLSKIYRKMSISVALLQVYSYRKLKNFCIYAAFTHPIASNFQS